MLNGCVPHMQTKLKQTALDKHIVVFGLSINKSKTVEWHKSHRLKRHVQEFQTATNMTVIWVFQWTQVQISFFFFVADSEKM